MSMLITIGVFISIFLLGLFITLAFVKAEESLDKEMKEIDKTARDAINEKYKDIGVYEIRKDNAGNSDYLVKLKADNIPHKYVDVHYETDDEIEIYEVNENDV